MTKLRAFREIRYPTLPLHAEADSDAAQRLLRRVRPSHAPLHISTVHLVDVTAQTANESKTVTWDRLATIALGKPARPRSESSRSTLGLGCWAGQARRDMVAIRSRRHATLGLSSEQGRQVLGHHKQGHVSVGRSHKLNTDRETVGAAAERHDQAGQPDVTGPDRAGT